VAKRLTVSRRKTYGDKIEGQNLTSAKKKKKNEVKTWRAIPHAVPGKN